MELEPIFNDIQLQNDFDRDGYVTVDFLNADEVLYLLNLHRRFEDRFLNGFVASIMIADQTYRSVVDREVRDIFETKVEQLLNRYQ